MLTKTTNLYAIATIMMFAGVFMPWVSIFGLTATGAGTTDGKLTIAFALLSGFAAFMAYDSAATKARFLAGIPCLIALALAVYNIIDIMSFHTDASDGLFAGIKPSVGIGLWVIAIGAAVGLVGAVRVPVLTARNAVTFDEI